MRAWAIVMLLASGGCAHRFVECNDTLTCRVQVAERDRQYALRVAEEPAAQRLPVETVSPEVLVDASGGLVYALDPALVALERQTGVERWRAAGMNGLRLWRLSRFLVVEPASAERAPELVFIDPEAPAQAVRCRLSLRAPLEAASFDLHPFDRGGQPYVFWSSRYSYRGGTPPGPEHQARAVAAEGCGVVRLDPRTCAAQEARLADFLWDPPEGRRRRPGEHDFCAFLSPLRDLPAAAASAPQEASHAGLRLRATRETPPGACFQRDRVELEALDGDGKSQWVHRLADRAEDCPPP